jgi:hypothetical protein
MDLIAAVKKYVEVTGRFGEPMPLSQFGVSKAETEKTICAWDEDYQINRYLLLSRARDEELASFPPDLRVFLINGYECTHLSFRPDIQKLL